MGAPNDSKVGQQALFQNMKALILVLSCFTGSCQDLFLEPNAIKDAHLQDTQQCAVMSDTDFNGHDLQPTTSRYATSPDECCSLCANNTAAGCNVWTFMPPSVCYLKTSAAGQRQFQNYVSGCIGPCPSPPPPSPPPTPSPTPPGQPIPHG